MANAAIRERELSARPGGSLLGLNHECRGVRYPLRPGVLLGRHVHADVFLPDARLRRVHARAVARGSRLWLRAVPAGAFLNGEPFEAAPVAAGDVLSLGRFAFRVQPVAAEMRTFTDSFGWRHGWAATVVLAAGGKDAVERRRWDRLRDSARHAAAAAGAEIFAADPSIWRAAVPEALGDAGCRLAHWWVDVRRLAFALQAAGVPLAIGGCLSHGLLGRGIQDGQSYLVGPAALAGLQGAAAADGMATVADPARLGLRQSALWGTCRPQGFRLAAPVQMVGSAAMQLLPALALRLQRTCEGVSLWIAHPPLRLAGGTSMARWRLAESPGVEFAGRLAGIRRHPRLWRSQWRLADGGEALWAAIDGGCAKPAALRAAA